MPRDRVTTLREQFAPEQCGKVYEILWLSGPSSDGRDMITTSGNSGGQPRESMTPFHSGPSIRICICDTF